MKLVAEATTSINQEIKVYSHGYTDNDDFNINVDGVVRHEAIDAEEVIKVLCYYIKNS